ncbi:MAG TPA: hypothetical protein VEQ10_06705, partial [Vicinamibacteria bacterium]|nr:hypothetical protein [Vicinamibacteria bacterium]
MPGPGRYTVESGSLLVYRLFDVADAVDLALAERSAGPSGRFTLETAQSATALQFPRPPVQFKLGSRTLPMPVAAATVEATAHVYDFGVVSVCYQVPIAPGTPLEALVPLAESLLDAPTPALDQAARRDAEALAASLAPALERPHAWQGLETYHVFFVQRLGGEQATAAGLLAGAPLAELLLGETSAAPLSEAERQDVLSHHHTYLSTDLAVIHWNCAFVLEPSGADDVPDLLEFATAHLLELRYYDALLDRELHAIYDEVEQPRSTLANVLTRRYRLLQRRTAALLLELSEMIERLENTIRIVGDFYLARLYQTAVRRFRLPSWQGDVLRKQKLLAEVNDL